MFLAAAGLSYVVSFSEGWGKCRPGVHCKQITKGTVKKCKFQIYSVATGLS